MVEIHGFAALVPAVFGTVKALFATSEIVQIDVAPAGGVPTARARLHKLSALLLLVGHADDEVVNDAGAVPLRNAQQFDTTGAFVEEMTKAAVLPHSRR